MNISERMKAAHEHFNSLIEKHGWAAHYVPLDRDHINYHTHGVELNYKHLDFQITLPLDQSSTHGVTTRLINDVKLGTVFEEGKEYYGYLKEGYKIGFKKYVECGRDVLRVLICDSNNLLPYEEDCDKDYKYQLDVLED